MTVIVSSGRLLGGRQLVLHIIYRIPVRFGRCNDIVLRIS